MRDRGLPVAMAAIGLMYITVALSAAGIRLFGIGWDLAAFRSFSDALGPINAILAAVAAVAALKALAQQKEETAALAARAIEDAKSSYRRDFENTFFRLIGLLNEIVAGTEYQLPHETTQKGHKAFEALLLRLESANWGTDDKREQWEIFYAQQQGSLAHYFRLLYQILRYIDEAEIDNRGMYVRFLRANLSSSQLILLGVDAGWGSYPAMRRLVEKHAMLHNVLASHASRWQLDQRFAKSAFGKRKVAKK